MIRILTLVRVISREVIQLALITLVLMILFKDVSCLPRINTTLDEAEIEDYVEIGETARENRGLASMTEKCRERCISKFAPTISKYSSSAQIDPLNSVSYTMPQHNRIKRVGRAKKVSSYSYSQCLYEISDCLKCWKSCQSLEPPETQDYLSPSQEVSEEIPVNSVLSTFEAASSHWKPLVRDIITSTSTTTPFPIVYRVAATSPSPAAKSATPPIYQPVTQPMKKYLPMERGNDIKGIHTEGELTNTQEFKRHSNNSKDDTAAAVKSKSSRTNHVKSQESAELIKRKHKDQMMLIGLLLQRAPQKQQRRRYNNYDFYRRQKSLNTTELEIEETFIQEDELIIMEEMDR